MKQFFIGVDIGGTGVKTAIVDTKDKAIFAKNIATQVEKGFKHTISLIANQIKGLIKDQGVSLEQIAYIGMGIPGLTDGKSKIYMAPNVNWLDVDIEEEMKKYFPKTKIYIANDASVAALAEYRFGSMQNTTNAVMITLGAGGRGGARAEHHLGGDGDGDGHRRFGRPVRPACRARLGVRWSGRGPRRRLRPGDGGQPRRHRPRRLGHAGGRRHDPAAGAGRGDRQRDIRPSRRPARGRKAADRAA